MAYPLQCRAGFPMPLKAGKFKIAGIMAAVDNTAAASELFLFDDDAVNPDTDTYGRILSSTQRDEAATLIAPLKGIANVDGTIGVMFSSGIKTRYGTSIYVTNTKPGTVTLLIE